MDARIKSKVLYTRSFCARLLMQALGSKGAREDTGTGIRTETGKALGTGRGKEYDTSRGHQILCPPSAIAIR